MYDPVNVENGSISLKDTTQPVDSEEEGRSSTMDRRWLIERKKVNVHGVEVTLCMWWIHFDGMMRIYFY